MKNAVVSRRYARALLLIGKEDGQTETYRAELGGFAALVAGNDALEQAVCSPLYDPAARKNVLKAVIAAVTMSPVMTSFLLLLQDKGRLGVLPAINQHYQQLADEVKGVARAQVVTAMALSPGVAEKIQNVLSRKTGKDVLLDIREDPGLIGGVVTKIGDLVFDGSVKTQLLNMRESLKRGEGV